MTSRGLRTRAPVNYNDKTSMEPAWLRSIGTAKSDTPPKKVKTKSKSSSGSEGKENAAAARKSTAPKLKSTQPAVDNNPPQDKPVESKPSKPRKSTAPAPKDAKPASQPARGRNAGLTVVPIGECHDLAANSTLGLKFHPPHLTLYTLIYPLYRRSQAKTD